MKVLALIPARGGSKEIPKKNIQKIGRNSLLKQTISHAKKSKVIDKIVVEKFQGKMLQCYKLLIIL